MDRADQRLRARVAEATAEAVACLRDWGVRGLAERARPAYLRHRYALRRAELRDSFDRTHATETNAKVRTRRYGLSPDAVRDAVMYWPTPMYVFREAHAALPIEHERFAFVDLGSGKGRVVMLAAEHPYRRVVGVELSRMLHERAQANLAARRARPRQCRDVELVCAPAEQFDLPRTDLVLFLFNPFAPPLLETILGRVEASLREHPRVLYLVYVDPYPAHLEVVARASFLHQVAASPNPPDNDRGGRFAWYLLRNGLVTGPR